MLTCWTAALGSQAADTADISYTYDRLGRQVTVTDGYDTTGRLSTVADSCKHFI